MEPPSCRDLTLRRLRPATRCLRAPSTGGENIYRFCGGRQRLLTVGFRVPRSGIPRSGIQAQRSVVAVPCRAGHEGTSKYSRPDRRLGRANPFSGSWPYLLAVCSDAVLPRRRPLFGDAPYKSGASPGVVGLRVARASSLSFFSQALAARSVRTISATSIATAVSRCTGPPGVPGSRL